MKIVIDVPEKLAYEGFERTFTEEEKNVLIKAIGNGTPLPKGHGRLIDALKDWPKSGDWIFHHNGDIDYIECSECWSWYVGSYLTRRNYCPNCGAKMQVGGKE